MEVREAPPRQAEPSPPSNEEEASLAAAIALILAGQIEPPEGVGKEAAIAALLGTLPDAPVPSVRDAAARLVAGDSDPLPDAGEASAPRSAFLENLIHRAHYAINAARRMGRTVRSGESLKAALNRESTYLAQHREANRRRSAAARMIEAAVELHGPVLGWKHGHPKEPREAHAGADGMNFSAATIPMSTGALPGVLPGCTCTVVAPYPDGEMMR